MERDGADSVFSLKISIKKHEMKIYKLSLTNFFSSWMKHISKISMYLSNYQEVFFFHASTELLKLKEVK